MRQLLPEPIAEVDPSRVYGAVERTPPPGRPWVLANMVASVDGSAAVGERSGPLGGPADKVVFRILRSLADVVLVGAGTVRAEGYGPVRGADPAALAVVSRSLALDPDDRLFTEAVARTIVVTCAASDPARRATLGEVAEVIVAGTDSVDPARALAELGARGHRTVLCEGGPALLAQVAAAGVLDELCLTTSPLLALGDGPRITTGISSDVLLPRRLATLLEDDGMLFARYLAA